MATANGSLKVLQHDAEMAPQSMVNELKGDAIQAFPALDVLWFPLALYFNIAMIVFHIENELPILDYSWTESALFCLASTSRVSWDCVRN